MFHRVLLHRNAVYIDPSFLRLIKSGDQLYKGSLGRSCLADDPYRLPRLYVEGNI